MKTSAALLVVAACLAAAPGSVRGDEPSPQAMPFIGHSGTKKVHRRACRWGQRIATPNRVYFKTYREAAEEGFTACRVCAPDAGPAVEAAPIVGHRGTREAHRRECRVARKIPRPDRVGFADWGEAKAAGYAACGRCTPDLETPAAVPPPALPAGGFYASSSGKAFHAPGCPWAAKIPAAQRVHFKTRDEALAAGKTPCGACKP